MERASERGAMGVWRQNTAAFEDCCPPGAVCCGCGGRGHSCEQAKQLVALRTRALLRGRPASAPRPGSLTRVQP